MAHPEVLTSRAFDGVGLLQRVREQVLASCDALLLLGLCALLLFGPLAFGTTENWSILCLETATAILFIIWTMKQVISSRVEISWTSLYAPMVGFGVVVLIQLLFRVSAYPYATFVNFLLYLAYAALFFLAKQCFQGENRLRALVVLLGVFGFLFALFALVQDFTFNGNIYWLREPPQPEGVFGSYFNHNHYAGLMEMLTPIPLVFCLTSLRGGKRVLAGFASLVMASTIFFSQSRGGMLSFAVELAFLAVLLSAKARTHRVALASALFLAALLALLVWFGGPALAVRMQSLRAPLDDSVAGMRPAVARDCLRMFAARPFWGWGLETFPLAYPQFQSFYTDEWINQAHNDYLQVLTETGLAGFTAVIVFVVLLYREALGRLRRVRSNLSYSLSLAALTGCTGILVHSFLDFNLHVPANVVMFLMLCAVVSSPLRRRGNQNYVVISG